MQTIEIHYRDIGFIGGDIPQDGENPGRKSQHDSCRGAFLNYRYPYHGEPKPRRLFRTGIPPNYSTVTDFARFLGLSTSHPRISAI